MEFDMLQDIWREVGRAGGPAEAFERRLLRGLGADRLRSTLVRLKIALAFEIAAGMTVAFLTGGYLAGQIGLLRFAVPALILHAVAIAMIVMPIRHLVTLNRIDYSEPVLRLQKRLGALRVSRVRGEMAILVLAPLLWTPLAIVGAHGLLGLDLYAEFGVPWVTANLCFGVAVLIAAIWVSHRYGNRLGSSRVWRTVSDSLAGRSLAEAQGFLESVVTFEGPS